MAESCTCGAKLPEDAVFCHKCGKPQREILEPEVEHNSYLAAPSQPLAAEEDAPVRERPLNLTPPPLNFHNTVAVRIALVAAVSATILVMLAPILNWLAAGFFAVFFYCRKTGFRLDVSSGVKIGWITGLIAYVFYVIVFTAQQLPDVFSGHPGRTILEQMRNSQLQDPATVQQFANMVQSDPGLVLMLLLVLFFVLVTVLSMVGGALGAKLAGSSK